MDSFGTSQIRLTEFLLARLSEDEEACQAAPTDSEWIGGRLIPFQTRLLAECEARRRIVDKFATWERENRTAWKDYSRWAAGKPTPPNPPARTTPEAMQGLDFAIRVIASVYADHPDYRDEWRP